MAYSLTDDVDKCSANDGTMSQDEFMKSIDLRVKKTIRLPEEFIHQSSTIDASERRVESEISEMLQIAPGILPSVDRLPKSNELPKPTKQPDFIS